MNHSTYTRFASLVLAIGFFFSCTTSKPTINSLIESASYSEALTAIDESLASNPDQPELLIQKGEIYLTLAENESVPARKEFYQNATNAFSQAKEVGLTEAQDSRIDNQLLDAWENEFNTGSNLYKDDTLEESRTLAQAHFVNAIAIYREKPKPYLSLSVAQYNNNNIDDAIATLNDAKANVNPVPEQVYENLGFLYLQAGNTEQSVFYYELANTVISENKNIAFGLVNIYILNNQTEKAIDLLSDLAKHFPQDSRIRNVYGTQLYLIASKILDDLAEAYRSSNSGLIAQIKFEAEGVSEQAEEELISAYQLEETNQEYVESLAVFYNNMTSKYLAVAEVSTSEDQEIFETKAEILLDFAIEYYGKLASFNPNNPQIEETIATLNRLKESRF